MVPMSLSYLHGMYKNVTPSMLPVKRETYTTTKPYMLPDLHTGHYQAFSLSNDNFAKPGLLTVPTCSNNYGSLQSSTQAKNTEQSVFPTQFNEHEHIAISSSPESMLTANKMTLPTIPHIPDILSPEERSPPRLPLRDLKLPSNNWSSMAELSVSANMDQGYVSPNTLSPLTDSSSSASTWSSHVPDDLQSNISDIIDEVLKLEKSDFETSPINMSNQNCNKASSFSMTFGNEIGAISRASSERAATLSIVNSYTTKASQKTVTPVNFELQSPSEQQFQTPTAAALRPFNTPWWHPLTHTPINQSSDDMWQTDRNYQCLVCGKYFQNKNNLKMHFKCHSGERPFACTYCTKRFTQKSTLRTHIRTHTGEKPYACGYCSRAFSDYSTYRKHVRIHTGERPYVCDVCLKGFAQSGNMIRHREIHFKQGRNATAGPVQYK